MKFKASEFHILLIQAAESIDEKIYMLSSETPWPKSDKICTEWNPVYSYVAANITQRFFML